MKKYNTKLLTIFATFIIALGTASAVQTNPSMAINASSPNIQQGELQNVTFVDSLTGSLSATLAFAEGPENVEPGESVQFAPRVEFEEETLVEEGYLQVTEFYRCNDSGCDDPNQDVFVEADRQRIPFSLNKEAGTSWKWDVEYTVPEDESYYAGAAYIYDPDAQQIVSTVNEHVFQVTSGNDNGGTDDGDTSTDVDLKLAASPYFEVDEGSNSVDGNIVIGNYGSEDMSGSDIVEMQVRPGTQNPLSFASVQGTCDSDYPNNVHKEYSIDGQDSLNIDLTADSGLQDGEQYTVYFLTRSECGGERTDPIRYSYNAGSFTFEGGDDEVSEPSDPEPEPEEPSIEQISKPQLSFEDGTVSTRMSFKNTGGDMTQTNIVEMQVRPQGQGPLAFSSTQNVCDEEFPNNVHKEFELDSGETATTTLSTEVNEAGKYEVFLLTRNDCFPDNEPVQPYNTKVDAGTVTVNPGLVGFVETVRQNALPVSLAVGGVILLIGGAVLRWL